MNEMGFLSTQSHRPSRLRNCLGLAVIAILGGLALGCSDSIDGVPSCDAKKLVVTGQSAGRTIDIDATFSGGLTQGDKDAPGGVPGGTMALKLNDQSTFTLTWNTVLEDGAATTVTGSVQGVPGGPLCYGGDSQVELGGDSVTFHLQALHACDASSFVLGEIFGCAGLSGN
jgi:hypothetical protein